LLATQARNIVPAQKTSYNIDCVLGSLCYIRPCSIWIAWQRRSPMKKELRWRGPSSISKFHHHNINGGAVDDIWHHRQTTCKLNLVMRYLWPALNNWFKLKSFFAIFPYKWRARRRRLYTAGLKWKSFAKNATKKHTVFFRMLWLINTYCVHTYIYYAPLNIFIFVRKFWKTVHGISIRTSGNVEHPNGNFWIFKVKLKLWKIIKTIRHKSIFTFITFF
jgi:hypothetical protein